ncbi:MAG: radical SAM protein [Candidatus Bathyarchaeia archaeon]
MLLDTLKLLKLGMGNPLSRAVIRIGDLIKTGELTGLELALKCFAFNMPTGGIVNHAYYLMLKAVFGAGCRIFGVDLDSTRRYLKDPVVRRGVATVLSSIGCYGVTCPQLLKAPFLVVWNFTNTCNLKCKHCYQSAGARSPDELTLKEKLRLVDELADAGVVSLAFSGGEPLMSPDFYRVAEAVRNHDMHVALATNGTMITEGVARMLKKIDVCYVEVSLDAASAELHDKFRGVQGAYARALEGIKNCVDQGIFTSIAMTVTKYNLAEVPELIRLGRQMKVNRFIHFNFIPAGRGREIVELDITPEERESLLQTLFEECKTPGMEVLSTAPQFGRIAYEESSGGSVAPTHFYVGNSDKWGLQSLAQLIGGCGAGRLYCAIQPNGLVTPCVFMPNLYVGDLRKTRFKHIWSESKVLRELRNKDMLKPKCGVCERRYVCGGCRARSLGYFSDYLAPDVGCIKNVDGWERLKGEVAAEA